MFAFVFALQLHAVAAHLNGKRQAIGTTFQTLQADFFAASDTNCAGVPFDSTEVQLGEKGGMPHCITDGTENEGYYVQLLANNDTYWRRCVADNMVCMFNSKTVCTDFSQPLGRCFTAVYPSKSINATMRVRYNIGKRYLARVRLRRANIDERGGRERLRRGGAGARARLATVGRSAERRSKFRFYKTLVAMHGRAERFVRPRARATPACRVTCACAYVRAVFVARRACRCETKTKDGRRRRNETKRSLTRARAQMHSEHDRARRRQAKDCVVASLQELGRLHGRRER